MFHACVHALIAALSHFCRPLTRLCVINKDKQKNPVGTTQETQFNTSIQHAAAPRPASHCPCADSRLCCESGVIQSTPRLQTSSATQERDRSATAEL